MAKTEVPTGDSIADQIKSRPSDQSNFSDIARMLTSDHDHRPGLFQQDLAKVNDALHAKGLLPGVDIVGMNGQDFVAKSQKDQSIVNVDATDLTRMKAADNGKVFSLNGRLAAVNGDGSGNLVVQKGDNPWKIGADILKSQGVDNPTDRQIANMYKELQQLNPSKTLDHLKPGDKINYPASVVDGTDTKFQSDRANATADQSKKDAQDNYDGAMNAMGKFGENAWGGLPGAGGLNITMDEVNQGLARTDITDADRKSLNFIKDNFNQIAVDGRFWQNDLGAWKDKMTNLAEVQRISDIKD
ncbi:MAG TPA: hypothetical protein V6C76_16060 [Drouetiella sp.]